MTLNDLLQWAAIVALFFFVCYARGSAVAAARAELRRFDRMLGAGLKGIADEIRASTERSRRRRQAGRTS